jgi:hypothetical protein
MATYKGIKGFSIQNLSADPSNLIEGEMWYNSTSNVWKVEETYSSWNLGKWWNSLNTARVSISRLQEHKQQVYFGGTTPLLKQELTEEYDGSTWTNNPTGLNTARRTGFRKCWYSNSSFRFWWL